ncbi:MAG: EamA family transporter [Candidatus Bipolaricaulia bacterium]
MSPFAVALVLFSTFMHAGWNLLARRQRSEMVFFRRMLVGIAFVGFVPAVLSEVLTHSLPPQAWGYVAGSGFFCGLYIFHLARAYGSSDFTVVYPVARALPVLLVGIGDVLRGRFLTAMGWLGVVLVILGCVLTPLHSVRDVALRRYLNRTNLWMLLAALGTVGYTLLDKAAAELVQQGPATAARYGYIYFLICFGTYTVLVQILKPKEQSSNAAAVGWIIPMIASSLSFGAYWLILWTYQLTQRASYIVAFRQFSIVIGVVLAFAIYQEKGLVIRLTGTLLITFGLILIGVLGG